MSDETIGLIGYTVGMVLTIAVSALLGWWIYDVVRTFFGLPFLTYWQYLLVFILGKIMFGSPLLMRMPTKKGG